MFRKIVKELNLGELIEPPQKVTGGLMYKMYRVETAAGKYAVKLLNPEIMKRPDVFENYRTAECLEKVLQENEIPIIPALEFNGRKMQCIDNQYFYVFRWIDGKALRWEDIEDKHCQIAGTILAKIHKIKRSDKPLAAEKARIDWDAYISEAYEKCSEIAEILIKNRDFLYSCQAEYNLSLDGLPSAACICHGDMDSKNILWSNGKPWVIDLECLSYGSPHLEMYPLALDWAGSVICRVDYGLLRAFILAYRREYGNFHADWDALYGSGFGWIFWLEYSVKRALMIECNDEEERQAGIDEVHETLRRISYYNSIRDELLRQLHESPQ